MGRRLLLTAALLALTLLAPPRLALSQELPEEERVRWERQIAFIEARLRAEPSVPLHYLRMAQAWGRLGDERRVLEYTEAAVRLGGSPLAADILVGDFYSNVERPGDALQRYLRVLKTSPQQGHVLTQIWFLVRSALDPESPARLPVRLEDLVTLLNMRGYYVAEKVAGDPEGRVKSFIEDGNRRIGIGDLDGARAAFEAAANLDPWSSQIYRGLGIIYAKQRQPERAVGAYTLFVALAPPGDPTVPQARNIIFEFYRKRSAQPGAGR